MEIGSIPFFVPLVVCCRIGFSSESKPFRTAGISAVLERLFSLKTLKTVVEGRWSCGCYFAVIFDFSHYRALALWS